MVQKSRIKLTKPELDFISDPLLMQIKQKLIHNLQLYLNGLGQHLAETFYLPNTTYKITRGENYQNQPYVVLDVPQIKPNQINYHMRIVLWWGNYISFQYFLGVDDDLAAQIQQLPGNKYVVLITDNLFSNNLQEPCFIQTPQIAPHHLHKLHTTKICQQVTFNELENLEELATQFLKTMQSLGQKKGGS